MPLAIHARLYRKKNAEITADFLPKPPPSPGDQSVHIDDPHVPAPHFLVHSCLVALSPDPTALEPIPPKSKLVSPLGCSLAGRASHPSLQREWTLPSTLPSLSLPCDFMRSHFICFLAVVSVGPLIWDDKCGLCLYGTCDMGLPQVSHSLYPEPSPPSSTAASPGLHAALSPDLVLASCSPPSLEIESSGGEVGPGAPL